MGKFCSKASVGLAVLRLREARLSFRGRQPGRGVYWMSKSKESAGQFGMYLLIFMFFVGLCVLLKTVSIALYAIFTA